MKEAVRWRGRRRVLAAALAAAAGMAVGAPPSGAADDARVLELVTEPGAARVDAMPTLLPDGERVVWHTPDALLGSPDSVWNAFASERGATGWTTSWLTPRTPDTLDYAAGVLGTNIANFVYGTSPDGRDLVLRTNVALVPQDTNVEVDVYALRDGVPTLLSRLEDGTAAGLGIAEQITRGDESLVAAPDGRSALLQTDKRLVASAGGVQALYALGADGDVRLIQDRLTFAAAYRSMSDDGRVVAYVAGSTLRVWRDGVSTDVAESSGADNSTARVSADGATIWFTSRSAIDPAAPAGVASVYAYDVAGGTFTRLSGGAPGFAQTDAASLVLVSEDDSTVFFRSTERLTADAPADVSVKLYARTGDTTRFVAPHTPAPTGLTTNMRVSADGGTVLLQTALRLDPARDTDGDADLYRVRAGAAPELVSAGTTGANATGLSIDFGAMPGNGPGYGWLDTDGLNARSLSDDGQTVVFSSTAALTPDAGDNDRTKVYVWRDGRLTLVSGAGRDAGAAALIGADRSGRSAFFVTFDSLVAEDTDGGRADLYDARVGGGFPRQAPVDPCPANACDGPPAPVVAPPATTTFSGPGDPPVAAEPTSRFTLRRSARRLTFQLPGAGRLELRGTVRSRGRAVVVYRASRAALTGGRVRVTVTLNRRGRALLARSRRGRLTVRVRSTFAVEGAIESARSTTVTFRAKRGKR